MAIFIVDQFSLNTDRPLDVRYDPSGGSYNDVSLYWYPGMQVYQTSDQKIWYADNSLNWQPLGGDLDGSVNELYTFFNDLSTLVYIHEASIGELDASMSYVFNLTSIHDISIGDIYVRLNTLDTSVATLTTRVNTIDGSITYLDSSVTQLFGRVTTIDGSITYLDSSVTQLFGRVTTIDASITNIYDRIDVVDGSITDLYDRVDVIDGSITYLDLWNQSQDASIVDLRQDITDLESSLGLFVLKAGDTMTGALVISAGGLQVANDVSVLGNQVIVGDLTVGGDLTVDGSVTYVNTTTLEVSTNLIWLNTGLTGAPPETLQSGIVVGRGNEEPYVFLFDETDQTFRIGITQDTSTGFQDASTQAVSTREDNPTIDGVAVWNNTQRRFDTYSALTFDGTKLTLDASLVLSDYAGAQNLMLVVQPDGYVVAVPTSDASINDLYLYIDGSLAVRDASITALFGRVGVIDGSITNLYSRVGVIDGSITNLYSRVDVIDGSITFLDSSVSQLFDLDASNIKGAANVGDGSAAIYAGTTGQVLQLRTITGVGAAVVTQNGNVIEISLDASFAGEVNTASNVGDGEGIFYQKVGSDLELRSLKAVDPAEIIISTDGSTITFDVSIATATSLVDLTDTSIDEPALATHQIIEYDASAERWINTNNLFWDTSLGTTTDDLGGVPQGTNLEGQTLKDILYRILYEYQVPVLDASTDPLGGIYEKGLVATQFASIDVNYFASNANYPLAKLNNLEITKTGEGTILDVSFGLLDSSSGTYTDTNGILNWGGTNRTINYNVYVSDDQGDQTQPAVMAQSSFTFYYRQFWGTVDGNTIPGQVDSTMINGLSDSRLAGETDLLATFVNPGAGFIKYLLAYPDTVASPDNFGVLSQIIDQNGFEISDSFNTGNIDVSIGGNQNVQYRYYLLKNKVTTSTFDITFKF